MRYVRSETEKLRIVRCCHADPTSGHLGEKRPIIELLRDSHGKESWKM